MGLFKRASDVVESRVNQLLNKFEDPNALLDLSYEKMLDGLQQVKHHLADIVTEQKSLEKQLANLDKELEQRDEEARAALKVNREDLAKEALLRKQQTTERRRGLAEAHEHINVQVNKLKDAEQMFQDRITAFKTQKEISKAGYQAAKAQVKIGEHMSGIGHQLGGVGETLQRANDKADQMMARADAMESLMNEGILDDPLDKRDKVTRELDEIRRHSAVDDELERMKKELGKE